MIANLDTRLAWCAREGALTNADLAFMFDVPYRTLRTWMLDGRQPRGREAQIETMLRELERVIGLDGSGLPVPTNIRLNSRKEHLRRIRDAIRSGDLPSPDAAGSRVQGACND